MILGLSLSTYTSIHVIISLITIATGFITVFGMLTGNRMARWTAIFLVMTILTSVTGFGLPFNHFLPSHAVGAISLVFLAVALFAVTSNTWPARGAGFTWSVRSSRCGSTCSC